MHSADTVGVWRIMFVIRLVLNYVIDALTTTTQAATSLLHMVSTHHFHSNAAAMQAFV